MIKMDVQIRRSGTQSERGTLHYVVRIPLITVAGRDRFNTVEAHNEKIDSTGATYFAKIGANVGPRITESLRSELDAGRLPRLILVVKRGDAFLGYEAPIVLIQSDPQTKAIKELSPDYYADLDMKVALWIKVNEPFRKTDLTKFGLFSNKRNLIEVLRECRTSAMLVEDLQKDRRTSF